MKTPDLSDLLTTKDEAAPPAGMPARAMPDAKADQAATSSTAKTGGPPISLRVPPDVRKRFRLMAAQEDLKLNELFIKIFKAYEESRNG